MNIQHSIQFSMCTPKHNIACNVVYTIFISYSIYLGVFYSVCVDHSIKVGPTQQHLLSQQYWNYSHITRVPPVSTSGLDPETSWFRDKHMNHCTNKVSIFISYSIYLGHIYIVLYIFGGIL